MMRRAAAVAAFAALFAATPARADIVLLQPGPEGADTSPYSFIPSLPRGNRDTNYVFSLVDETGSHNFETFVQFELPDDLLAPGETVVQAALWIYYAFDFTGFGEATASAGEVECRPVLQAWNAATMTWNNRPAFGEPVDVFTGVTSLGLIYCDVTELVAEWVAGVRPNYGFALTNPTERLIGFYSFDATTIERNLRPSLAIETGVGGLIPPIDEVPEPGSAAVAAAALSALGVLRARRRR
jgi:hypothetical protein